MTTALSSARERALELAVSFARDFEEITSPAQVVEYATEFHAFLTVGENPTASATSTAAAPTGSADVSPASASKPAPAAKSAAKAEAKAPAAKAAETKAPAVEAKTEQTAAAAKPAGKEISMTQVQQAVVKLVTKVGRDDAVKYMQNTFGSPNVSGLDTSKHSYADVLAKVEARIKAAEQPAEA